VVRDLNALRFSLAFFTSEAELAETLEAVEAAARQGPG